MTDLSRRDTAEVHMQSFVGKTLRGSYFLEELIGEGGFGGVFKSQQQFLGLPVRNVAVKLSKQGGINTDTAKDIFADAFLLAQAMDEMTDMEARSHLVQVYDLGIVPEAGNRGYIVMEFVRGKNLREQFVSYRRVPANILIEWAVQICSTLQGLHTLKAPVLHRDLKPENILLGNDLRIRVIDFGLAAKMVQHELMPVLQPVQGAAGTLDYMSPETTQGESVQASDVYSMGIILYEGLTGKRPFDHLIPPTGMPSALYNTWLYNAKRTVRPTPPSSLNNTVTAELDALVLRCLEFASGKRYYDAGELLTALRELDKPEKDPPDVAHLKRGRNLKSNGRAEAAYQEFQQGLAARSSSNETLFALLRESGEVLVLLKKYEEAVLALAKAWDFVKDTAILRSREERGVLLQQIIEAYRRIPNEWQARRYEELKARELSGR